MQGIGQVGTGGVQPQGIQQQESVRAQEAPSELRGARPSRLAIAGRVLAGIFTLGISEGIRAIVRHVRAGRAAAPQAPAAGLPAAAPRDDADKRAVLSALSGGGPLPEAHRLALSEAIGELARRFGEDLVPPGTDLSGMKGGSQVKSALAALIRGSEGPVTAEAFAGMVVSEGSKTLSFKAFDQRIRERMNQAGLQEGTPEGIRDAVLKNKDETTKRLRGCADRAAVGAVTDALMPQVDAAVALRVELTEAENSARELALTQTAAKTGIPLEQLRSEISLKKLNTNFNYLYQDFCDGKLSAADGAIGKAFTAAAENFADNKARLYASVDGLPLSPQMKSAWKADVLHQHTLSDGDMFTVLCGIGRRTDASRLAAALAVPGEFTAADIAGLMESLGASVTQDLISHYGEAGWDDLGGDGQGDARFYAVKSMLDAVPGLIGQLESRPELVAELREIAEEHVQAAQEQTGSRDPAVAERGAVQKNGAQALQAMLIELAVD